MNTLLDVIKWAEAHQSLAAALITAFVAGGVSLAATNIAHTFASAREMASRKANAAEHLMQAWNHGRQVRSLAVDILRNQGKADLSQHTARLREEANAFARNSERAMAAVVYIDQTVVSAIVLFCHHVDYLHRSATIGNTMGPNSEWHAVKAKSLSRALSDGILIEHLRLELKSGVLAWLRKRVNPPKAIDLTDYEAIPRPESLDELSTPPLVESRDDRFS